MKTTLVGDYEIPDFDEEIMTNLLVHVVDLNSVRQEPILIGIRNADQEIYRVIGAPSQHKYNNAKEELEDIGLVDDLQEDDREKNGYNAIFSLNPDADE